VSLPAAKPPRFSQSSKLLRILEDGDWHTTRDLLREVPCIVHSRISELRKRGYEIEHETVGVGAEGSRYRLISDEASAPSPVLSPQDNPSGVSSEQLRLVA